MDEQQNMERFSMENDFTDGQWIGGEFFGKQRKEKRVQGRDDALYGVFYEDSDSDDGDPEGGGRKRRRGGGDMARKKDFSKPVNFVSTGTFMPTEDPEKEALGTAATAEKEESEDEEEAASARPGLGLGFGLGLGLGLGLGFQSTERKKPEKSGRDEPMEEEEEEEVEEELLPTAFGKRIKEAAERRQREKERERMKEKKTQIPSASSSSSAADIAEFERHTKGIGMKLLEKMGYKGGGLGKNQQGRVAPIEAKLRPKNMGMGFQDYRETAPAISAASVSTDKEAKSKEAKEKPKTAEKLWLKKNRGKKKEVITAEKLLEQKSEQGGGEVGQKILDMRGRQVRVLVNLEHLNAEQNDADEDIPMPELQHNMRLIVDLVEADIQSFDKKLRWEKESAAALERERERLHTEVVRQRGQIEATEVILGAIEAMKKQDGEVGLEVIAETFSFLLKRYPEDYKIYNLPAISLSIALPPMLSLFRGWEPLAEPTRGVAQIRLWQELLQGEDVPVDYSIFPEADHGSSSPYTQLIVEAVFPALRHAATNKWEPRDPEPMLRFLETWEKLLPASVLESVLEHLIMPKLTTAVEAWDPRLETVPIHAWLHPWLPLLGQRMEPLYHPIRFKLCEALRAWHPSDGSAHAILSPWQTVFDSASWEQLLVRSIIPKLMGALQQLVVNPRSQQLEPFNWVMAWANAVPVHHTANLLEAVFFPKWHQVLYHWLCSGPNFDEVTEWYLGWKDLLTPELLANERIRRQLQIALDMMNQAVEGTPVVQPGARENISYLRVTEQRQFESQAAAFTQQQATAFAYENGGGSASASDLSLKEVVESFAEQYDIQFLPKVGRMHEGLQIYGFGLISICMDSVKQRLLAQSGERWTPVSLEQVLEMHRSRAGRWN